MTLFGLCKAMAELTADLFLIPLFNFQRNIFPPFSYPAGDLACLLYTSDAADEE